MLKKISLIAALAVSGVYANVGSVNVEIDMGQPTNIITHVSSDKDCLSFTYNATTGKYDGYKLANEPVSTTFTEFNEVKNYSDPKIFKKGGIVDITEDNSAGYFTNCTEPGKWGYKDFYPSVTIYSAKNIKMNRGWIYSSEFTKYFNVDMLFDVNDGLAAPGLTYQDIQDNPELGDKFLAVTLLLNKFNKNSFIFVWNDFYESNKDKIIQKLENLKNLYEESIKDEGKRQKMIDKVNGILTLVQYASAITEKLANTNVNYVYKNLTMTTTSGILWLWFHHNNSRTSINYTDKTETGNLVKTPILRLFNIPYPYQIVSYSGKLYLYNPTATYTSHIWIGGDGGGELLTYSCSGGLNSSNLAYCGVLLNKTTFINNIFDALNKTKNNMNTAIDNAFNSINFKEMNKALTDNLNIERVNISLSETYGTKNINALYENSYIPYDEFKKRLQAVTFIKQFKYLNSLDILREYMLVYNVQQFKNLKLTDPTVVPPEDLEQTLNQTAEAEQQAETGTAPDLYQFVATLPLNITTDNNGNTLDDENQVDVKDVSAEDAPVITNPEDANGTLTKTLSVVYLDDMNMPEINPSGNTDLLEQVLLGGKKDDTLLNEAKSMAFLTMALDSNNNVTAFYPGYKSASETADFKTWMKTYSMPEYQTPDLKFCVTSDGYYDFSTSVADGCTTSDDLHERFAKDGDTLYFVVTSGTEMIVPYNFITNTLNSNYPNLQISDSTINNLEIVHHYLMDRGLDSSTIASYLNGESDTNPLKVKYFFPFKAEFTNLIQDKVEIHYYTKEQVDCTITDEDGNETQGTKYVYVESSDPVSYPYQCRVQLKYTSSPRDEFLLQIISPEQGGTTDGSSVFKGAGDGPAVDLNQMFGIQTLVLNTNSYVNSLEDATNFTGKLLYDEYQDKFLPDDLTDQLENYSPNTLVDCSIVAGSGTDGTVMQTQLANIPANDLFNGKFSVYDDDYFTEHSNDQDADVNPFLSDVTGQKTLWAALFGSDNTGDGTLPSLTQPSDFDGGNPYKEIFTDGAAKNLVITKGADNIIPGNILTLNICETDQGDIVTTQNCNVLLSADEAQCTPKETEDNTNEENNNEETNETAE